MDKRDEILLAAAEEFASNGYPGTSFGSIGARLGMHRNALQYYVESKPELAAKIAWKAFHAGSFLTEDIALYGGVDGIARLVRCAAEQYVCDVFPRAALRLMEQRHLIPVDVPVPYQAWIERLACMLRDAAADRQLDPTVDVDDLALRLLATFAGTRMVCEALGELDQFPARAQRSVTELLRAQAPGFGVDTAPNGADVRRQDGAGTAQQRTADLAQQCRAAAAANRGSEPAARPGDDGAPFVGIPRPAEGGSARRPASPRSGSAERRPERDGADEPIEPSAAPRR